jgi:hypothetical protein
MTFTTISLIILMHRLTGFQETSTVEATDSRGPRDAHQKLRKYYRRTYQAEGYIYAIATILDPMAKLEKFKKGPWLVDETDWHTEYRRVFEKVFDLYRHHNPAIKVQSTVSGTLSNLDKAFFHISK